MLASIKDGYNSGSFFIEFGNESNLFARSRLDPFLIRIQSPKYKNLVTKVYGLRFSSSPSKSNSLLSFPRVWKADPNPAPKNVWSTLLRSHNQFYFSWQSHFGRPQATKTYIKQVGKKNKINFFSVQFEFQLLHPIFTWFLQIAPSFKTQKHNQKSYSIKNSNISNSRIFRHICDTHVTGVF